MKKFAYIIAAVILGLLIIIDFILFVEGSLEMFPTPEMIEKGRIVYGAVLVLLAATEIFVARKIVKM